VKLEANNKKLNQTLGEFLNKLHNKENYHSPSGCKSRLWLGFEKITLGNKNPMPLSLIYMMAVEKVSFAPLISLYNVVIGI
jgi:hypothetical protein